MYKKINLGNTVNILIRKREKYDHRRPKFIFI